MAAAAKIEVMKDKVWETRRQRQPRAIMKGDKLEKQDGSDSQERNHEGRQAWETSRQRQPKAKS